MTGMDAIQDAMRRYHTPGVAVGVLRDGRDEITTYGVTSIENPLPVQANTLFQIGSITKTITATMVMRLVEQGLLDLEAPVRRYLPELRLADEDVAQRVTLRHLLTHTAGFVGDDFSDTGSGDDAVARYVANMVELPQITPLGALFSYCNSGFVLRRPGDRGDHGADLRAGCARAGARAAGHEPVVLLADGRDDAPLRGRAHQPVRRRG